MSEIKRRPKKDPPRDETTAQPPRQTRVTLTRDVSSRYRKLVPRAQAAGGSAKPRPPRFQGSTAHPEQRGDHHKRGGTAKSTWKPHRPQRRDSGDQSGGASDTLKTLVSQELPEATRQLRETQELLRSTADEMLTLLEGWESRPPEENQDFQALVTTLFEKISFQDLAGQRLAKVEKFLKALDEIIQTGASTVSFQPRPDKPKTGPAEGQTATPQAEEKTLKGPQTAESRLGQNEVDDILLALLLR